VRKTGNWEKADTIRRKLADMGIEVRDFPEGTVWSFR